MRSSDGLLLPSQEEASAQGAGTLPRPAVTGRKDEEMADRQMGLEQNIHRPRNETGLKGHTLYKN